MNGSVRRGLLGATLLTVTGILASGCGGSPEAQPPGEMVLIAGNRQGVPSMVDTSGRQPEIVISSLRDELMRRFDREMTVSIIPADGDAQAQATERLEFDDRNGEKRKESPEKSLNLLSQKLATLKASSGESDLLGALDTGGRASSAAANKTLYVYDNGISTAGPLALQNGLLGTDTDVATIVEQLKASENIPNLEGMSVQWWGLGQVVSPQEDLPVWTKTKLKELWTAVIEAGGGSVVVHGDAVTATPPQGDLPEVTAVRFDDVEAVPVSVTIPESQIAFEPEKAQFANPASAKKTLKEIAADLKTSSVPVLWVTGCTANPQNASTASMQKLSEQRARSVAEALVAEEVGADLKVRGLGPACPGRSPESGTGSELGVAQAKNRRVLITSSELSAVDLND